MSSIPKEILDQLFEGESDQLEFKTSMRDPLNLARLIAGFANAHGGTILIGVSEPPEVIGVNPEIIRRIFANAMRQIEPATVQASLRFIDGGDGRQVAVVDVGKSAQLVLANGGAYVRAGTMTRPMHAGEIFQMLTHTPPVVQPVPVTSSQQTMLETVAQSLAAHTAHLEKISADNEELKIELKNANAPAARWKERFYGFGLGVVASLVATALAGL